MKTRSINLDLLRVMAMFFIVVFHYYVHGIMHLHTTPKLGYSIAYGSTDIEIFNYIIAEICLVISSAGVNLFVMMSGYFLISKKEYRIGSLSKLWTKVFLYSISITLFFFIIGKATLVSLVKAFFPLSTSQYWFITTYFGLMMIAPFISRWAINVNQNHYRKLLIALFVISFTFPFGRTLVGEGRNLIWFIFLYMLAGYVRLYEIPIKKTNKFLALITLLVSVCYIFYPFLLYFGNVVLRGDQWQPFFLTEPSNNGPVFFLAILIFIYFRNLKVNISFDNDKLISRISASTIGVYLISDNINLRKYLWEGLYDFQSTMSSIWAFPIMLAVCVSIFVITIVLDVLLEMILNKLKIGDVLCNSIDMILKKVKV